MATKELNVDVLADIITKSGTTAAMKEYNAHTATLQAAVDAGKKAAIELDRLSGYLSRAIRKAAKDSMHVSLETSAGPSLFGAGGREGSKSAVVRDAIVKALVGKTGGLTGGQVRKAMQAAGTDAGGAVVSLQLAKLIEQNKIAAKGEKRGKMYFPV